MKASASLVAFAAIALVACAHGKAWVATGESISVLGESFLATGRLMDSAYQSGRVSEAQYTRWRAFAKYFQPTYDTACDRWLHYDDSAGAHAAAVLTALQAELVEWGLIASGAKP